jgi:hypothetical protein
MQSRFSTERPSCSVTEALGRFQPALNVETRSS